MLWVIYSSTYFIKFDAVVNEIVNSLLDRLRVACWILCPTILLNAFILVLFMWIL